MGRPSIPTTGSRTALVVDDSRTMRAILRGALKEREFEVIEASDGRAALDLLEVGTVPELALIDWNMPRLNGLELIAILRSDDRYRNMVIVMITSETAPTQVERALAAGANEYIMKPLSPEVLRDKLVLLEEAGFG